MDAGGQAPPGNVSVALSDTSPKVDLWSHVELGVTINATSFTGAVSLAATGLPSDVAASFDDATPTLTGSSASVKLTLTTKSSAPIGQTQFGIDVTATGAQTHGASGVLTINPVITITIPSGVDQMQGNTSFGPYPITISAPPSFPLTINFYNADSVGHEIHADQATEGFFHGNGLIPPGGMDQPRNVTQADTYDWYLHDENGPQNIGRIVIQ